MSLRNEPTKWRLARKAILAIRTIALFRPRVDRDIKETDTESLLASDQLDKATLDQLADERKLEVLLEKHGAVEGIAAKLGTSLENGLNDSDVASRREKYGANELKNPPQRSFFRIVRCALLDRAILIMAACGAASLGFGIPAEGKEGAKEGVSIFVGIFFAVGVVFASEFWHDKVLAELHCAMENVPADVVRSGRHQRVPTIEIVVGDVVFLKPGDRVPGHGLLVDSTDCLKLKQLGREGGGGDIELDPIGQRLFLFSGAKVIDGFARMLVTSVGANESKLDYNSRDETVLDLQLETVDTISDWAGYVLAFLFVLYILIGTNANFVTFKDDDGKPLHGVAKINAIVSTVVGIITVVVNIPDPWKLSLSLTWDCALEKLMAHKALVLKPSALEALSYANTICIDATNKTKVVEFWLPSGKQVMEGRVYELLEEDVGLNSSSSDLTEKAILSWATEELKMDVEKVTRNCDIVKTKADDCEVQAHWFGAAELILPMCSRFYDASGVVKDINANQRSDFAEIVRGMGKRGLKCIAFAHKQILTEDLTVEFRLEEHRDMLVLLGFVGIYRIHPEEVKRAVKVCREAGVNVRLITGDSISVAKAMATECGIVSHDTESVIEGADFQKFSPTERADKIDEIYVMASSTTDDKLLMVKCLKEKGDVVAIISDAANSGESTVMNKADVILAMGTQGIEIGKENVGIVILDGNFSSIPELLKWGRCICSNVQKFIQFQLTASLSALVVNFVGAFSGEGVPLTTIQLLWVSLVTDTLGALAFSREKPEAELVKKPPARKTDTIVTNIMLRNIIFQTLYQIALLLTLNKGLILSYDDKVNLTLLFNSYLLCQVFNEFNSRMLEKTNVFQGIQRNRLFLSIIAFTVILQVIFVEILKKLIDTERLTWSQWAFCAGIAFATLPIGWIARFIPVPNKQVFKYVMVLGQIKEHIERPIFRKLRSLYIWTSWGLIRSNHAIEPVSAHDSPC